MIFFASKFLQEIYKLIDDLIRWFDFKQNHCSECGAALITYGYDEKRGCPNRCQWKKYQKEHPDLFK
jgi:hypothetical protein